MTLQQIIEHNFSSLLRCADPSIDLLGRLSSVPFVKDQISFVNQQPTDARKISALLNILREVPDNIQESVMNGLISALRSSGQDHVANIFRRESDIVPMSDEHYRILTVKKDELCEFIDTENKLLANLVSKEVISLDNEDDIRAMAGYTEKARKLIEVLTRKSDDAFDGLINALNQTGQSHVIYILTGEGTSRPLKEEYRERLLISKRDYLVKTIDSKSSGLITALMSKGVFSYYDKERVTCMHPDTNYDRNEMMLDLIARKSQSDFFNFIPALNDTDQTHVVVNLIGADIVAKIKTVHESGTDVGHIPGVDAELLEYMLEMFQRDGIVVKRLNELLSRNGCTVSGVREGCIEITITCENVESVGNLRELNDSGKLEQMLNEAFCPQFANKGLKSLQLAIPSEQFEQCAGTFAQCIPMTTEHRKTLLSSEELLVDKMMVSDDFLDKLSLCQQRRQAIETAATQEQQVKMLVDIVSRRPDSAFTELLNALKATNQHEAAAIICGDSTSEDIELQETRTEDVRDKAGHDLETLLRLIRKAEAGRSDEGFWPVFNRICITARDVAKSYQHLREHFFVPMSSLSLQTPGIKHIWQVAREAPVLSQLATYS